MKVLIISVKAGYGHHSTSKALIECFEKRGIKSDMLDTFDYISPVLSESIDKGYQFSSKNLPELYGKAYDVLDKRTEKYKAFAPISIISKMVSHKLFEYIKDYNPDAIIAPHSLACMAITCLKQKNEITCPTIGIVTDFTVHPFWESTDMDYYVTPDAVLNNQMRKKGIKDDKILPFGIPIRDKFFEKQDKSQMRNKLKVANMPTVLFMMGSMGFGDMAKQLEEIDEMDLDFQILCVCGNNEKMKSEIDQRRWIHKVVTFGFVDNVNELMDASDCIVTKPGGLTTSEFLAKGLPAVIMNPIPGQEDRNMEFLVNNGVAVMATQTFGIDEALYQILTNTWRLDLMQQAAQHLAKPNSTAMLCDFVENLVNSQKGDTK